MNNEELQGSPKGEPVAPATDSYGGFRYKREFQMENKRKLSVDYLNIVFKFETDVFKERAFYPLQICRVLGLDLDDLDGAGGLWV